MSETPSEQPTGEAENQAHEAPMGPPQNPYTVHAAQRSRSRKLWIWIVAGAVALAFTGIVVGFVMAALEAQQVGVPERGSESEAGAELATEFSWPANMATGGIVFIGEDGRIDIARSDAPDPETAPQPAAVTPNADGTAPAHIRLYVDYRCPVCAAFEYANGETLEQVVESGQAVLEVHPLTFLDRVDTTDYYSSRTAGAVACVATSQPEQTWSAHSALLSPAVQPSEEVDGHTDAELIEILDSAVGGLTDDTRECIRTQRFVPFAGTLNDWVFGNPVPGAVDENLTVSGTPFALVDGVQYTGAPNDPDAFAAFLEEQGISVDHG